MIIVDKEKVVMLGNFKYDIVPEFACISAAFYEKALKCVEKRPEDASVESTVTEFIYKLVKFSIEHAGTGEEIEPEEFFS